MPSKERLAIKRVRGECFDCSNQAEFGYTYCPICQQRHAARTREYHARHTQEHIEKERERRRHRVKNGRCQRCGGLMDPNDLADGLVNCPCNTDKHVGVTSTHRY